MQMMNEQIMKIAKDGFPSNWIASMHNTSRAVTFLPAEAGGVLGMVKQ